jgi:hypothetical protein
MFQVGCNFDWAETRGKKLVVFMPNFNHPELTEFSIKQIKTKIDPKDYLIVIGNDGIPYDWQRYHSKNVRYFNIIRDDKSPRNGAFVRNYFLKRCESELVCQKDGEVVIVGDFIYNIIHFRNAWRAGKIYVLNEEQTQQMQQAGPQRIIETCAPTRLIEMPVVRNSYELKEIIVSADGRVNPTSYFHYTFACKTSLFPYIGGYDEEYTNYGFEDSDVFCRLYHIGIDLVPDYSCCAIHPWHPRAGDCTPDNLLKMRQLFMQKWPADYFRNKTRIWGEGK